jgi:protein SCO1/2
MRRAQRHLFVVSLITVGSAVLIACSSTPQESAPQQSAPVSSQASAPQAQQRYDLTGKVVAIDKPGKRVTVDHEAIPGFMGAMTMAYPVKDEHQLDRIAPGDRITAKVVSTTDGFWLEDVLAAKPSVPAQ